MRDLKQTDRNHITLKDSQTGEKIGIYYSTPTTSQIKAYRQASVRRKGNKVKVSTFDPSLKWGLAIITGFDEGSFGFDGEPISSDPDSPNYREDWKDLLAETAADIVTIVGSTVFDGVRMGAAGMDVEYDEDEGGDGAEEAEDVVPFEKK